VVLIVAVIVSITAFSAMMAAGLVIIRARRRKGAGKETPADRCGATVALGIWGDKIGKI
jgi:hypothetical protein